MKTSIGGLFKLFVVFQVILLIFPASVFATATGYVPQMPELPAGVPTAVPSFTPSPAPSLNPANAATIGSCDKACTTYKETSAEQELTNACGVPPPPGTPATQIQNNGRIFANYSECQASIYGDGNTGKYGGPAARWGVLGQHCDAMSLMKTGSEQDLISGIVYTASGAVCTLACFMQYTAWGKATELACTIADLATIGVDVAGEVVLSQQADKATSAWDHYMETTAGDRVSNSLAFAGAGAGIAGAAVSVSQGGANGFKKGAGTAGKSGAWAGAEAAEKALAAAKTEGATAAADLTKAQAASDQADQALVKATQKADDAKKALSADPTDVKKIQDVADATKELDNAKSTAKTLGNNLDTAKGAATKAADKVADKTKSLSKAKNAGKAQAVLVCASAAFLLAAAGVKWAMYAKHQDNAAQECRTIKNMEGIGTANILSNGVDGATGGYYAPKASFDKATKSQPGQVDVSVTRDDGPKVDDNSATFPNGAVPQSAAATSQLFKAMPNLDKIPDALNQAGVPLSAIAKKLATSPPGETVASLFPDLPAEAVQQLKDIDKMALEGKLSMPGSSDAATPATYQGGGGGGGGSSGGSDLTGFGMKRGVAGATTTASKEIGFEKTKKEPLLLPADGDIFHGKFNGSIFQIISIRMGTTRERIDTLEWSTPLNRALMGLPPLSPHAPPPKGASEVKK